MTLAVHHEGSYNPINMVENDLQGFRSESAPDQEAPEQRKAGLRRFVLDILETLILSLLLFVVINSVSARVRVDGSSMEPTLHNGEFLIVNKLAYKLGSPAIGDVVVFHFPGNPDQEYIKRIIGLPGDQVVIQQGRVFVNGRSLEENYIAAPPAYEASWNVPQGAIFVLGDNRNNSSDSHSWGPVPLENVVGKAVFVYWPPQEWGMVDHIKPSFDSQ